eukprot:TRINITY_DN5732_c0_g1_i1.p1 TRINITY_DN5732_c0_g1~~TRINITY_DN5732_c0_g1_i1.p1  ORF type:complete len:593 (-),score=119.71 TRINITY_DN5732_c0_g1_i1:141-1874(-)
MKRRNKDQIQQPVPAVISLIHGNAQRFLEESTVAKKSYYAAKFVTADILAAGIAMQDKIPELKNYVKVHSSVVVELSIVRGCPLTGYYIKYLDWLKHFEYEELSIDQARLVGLYKQLLKACSYVIETAPSPLTYAQDPATSSAFQANDVLPKMIRTAHEELRRVAGSSIFKKQKKKTPFLVTDAAMFQTWTERITNQHPKHEGESWHTAEYKDESGKKNTVTQLYLMPNETKQQDDDDQQALATTLASIREVTSHLQLEARLIELEEDEEYKPDIEYLRERMLIPTTIALEKDFSKAYIITPSATSWGSLKKLLTIWLGIILAEGIKREELAQQMSTIIASCLFSGPAKILRIWNMLLKIAYRKNLIDSIMITTDGRVIMTPSSVAGPITAGIPESIWSQRTGSPILSDSCDAYGMLELLALNSGHMLPESMASFCSRRMEAIRNSRSYTVNEFLVDPKNPWMNVSSLSWMSDRDKFLKREKDMLMVRWPNLFATFWEKAKKLETPEGVTEWVSGTYDAFKRARETNENGKESVKKEIENVISEIQRIKTTLLRMQRDDAEKGALPIDVPKINKRKT